MRQDKLTTKFQEALGDPQSIALAHDNAYIEPVHLLRNEAQQWCVTICFYGVVEGDA